MNTQQINTVMKLTARLANVEDLDAFVEKNSKFVSDIVGVEAATPPSPTGWTDQKAKELAAGLTPCQRLILEHMHATGNRATIKDIHKLLLNKGGYTKIERATLPGILSGVTKKSRSAGMTKPFGWQQEGTTWFYVIYADAYQHLKKYL